MRKTKKEFQNIRKKNDPHTLENGRIMSGSIMTSSLGEKHFTRFGQDVIQRG